MNQIVTPQPTLPPSDKSSGEFAKIKIGAPPVVVETSVRKSWFLWLWNIVRAKKSLLDGVVVAASRAHLHASQVDDGTIDVFVSLVNVGKRPFTVEQLYLTQCLFNGVSQNVTGPSFTPPLKPIPAGSMDDIHFRFGIGAAVIRYLWNNVARAQNTLSSPRLEITVLASIDIAVGRRRERLSFRITAPQPQLDISEHSVPK